MNLYQAEKLARDLMNQHGLTFWEFSFDRAKVRFGCCHYHKKKITLSRELVFLNSLELVRDTILHEIAHALVGPKNRHNAVWKEKIKQLGGTPRARYRAHEVVMPLQKYTAKCPFCEKAFQARQKRKVACKFCCDAYNHGKYSEKYRIDFIKN